MLQRSEDPEAAQVLELDYRLAMQETRNLSKRRWRLPNTFLFIYEADSSHVDLELR